MKKISLLLFFLMCFRAYSQDQFQDITSYNTGQAFTCITLDSSGNVWAGSNKAGIFHLDKRSNPGATFSVLTEIGSTPVSNYTIQTIAADQVDKVWIGHAGIGGSSTGGGGMEMININNFSEARHFSPDRNAECYSFLQRDGIASLNISSIAVDRFNTVWSANRSHYIVSGSDFILTPGTFSYKRQGENLFTSYSTWSDYRNGDEAPELPYPAYTCNVPASATPGSRRCESIACSDDEVWVSVYPYEYTTSRKAPGRVVDTDYFPARIIRYNLNGQFLGSFTFEDLGASQGGVFKAIYLTPQGNAWVGLSAGKGFAAKIKDCWILLNNETLPNVFLPDADVGLNAIWGNNSGQVFIGTNKGLIVYNGVGKLDDPSSYTLYNTFNSGLSSDNITGGVSEKDTVIWVATDNGILRIKSDNNFSLEDDYSVCNDRDMNEIEAQTLEDRSRPDWHEYQITTVICDQNDPNTNNCNAQYVYNLMKNDVTLTTPTPFDYPYDNLSVLLLLNLSKEEAEIVLNNVQEWSDTEGNGNSFGGIKNIKQILSTWMRIKYYCTNPITCTVQGGIPLVGEAMHTRQELFNKAKAANRTDASPCASYQLYDSPNIIIDRLLYKKTANKRLCGDRLESADYDPVKVFPDDKNLTITNYTREGHFLHPGKVERRVVEECGQVKVVTTGTGLNYCVEIDKNDPDIEFAAIQQGKMNGNGNIVIGSILFKNIDIRLKEKFKTGRNPILH